MSDAPAIVTERFDLWYPRAGDMKAMHAIVSDPQTGRFLGRASEFHEHAIRFMRGAGSWALYGYGPFMVRPRGSDRLIGNCGIFHSFRGLGADFDDCPEAGWILAADQVGRGAGSEVMKAVLAWFEREHGRRRIVCMLSLENEPSRRLAERLGFTAMRSAVLPDGEAVTLFERLAA